MMHNNQQVWQALDLNSCAFSTECRGLRLTSSCCVNSFLIWRDHIWSDHISVHHTVRVLSSILHNLLMWYPVTTAAKTISTFILMLYTWWQKKHKSFYILSRSVSNLHIHTSTSWAYKYKYTTFTSKHFSHSKNPVHLLCSTWALGLGLGFPLLGLGVWGSQLRGLGIRFWGQGYPLFLQNISIIW